MSGRAFFGSLIVGFAAVSLALFMGWANAADGGTKPAIPTPTVSTVSPWPEIVENITADGGWNITPTKRECLMSAFPVNTKKATCCHALECGAGRCVFAECERR